jgi:hypothetical protein
MAHGSPCAPRSRSWRRGNRWGVPLPQPHLYGFTIEPLPLRFCFGDSGPQQRLLDPDQITQGVPDRMADLKASVASTAQIDQQIDHHRDVLPEALPVSRISRVHADITLNETTQTKGLALHEMSWPSLRGLPLIRSHRSRKLFKREKQCSHPDPPEWTQILQDSLLTPSLMIS